MNKKKSAAIGRSDKIASSAVVRQRNGGVGVGEEGSEGGSRDALSPDSEEFLAIFIFSVIITFFIFLLVFDRWILNRIGCEEGNTTKIIFVRERNDNKVPYWTYVSIQ